jgi:hypothetical protein
MSVTGLVEASVLLVSEQKAHGQEGRRLRWWRIYFLGWQPAAFGVVVAAIFGIVARSSPSADEIGATLGWCAGLLACLPASVSQVVRPGARPRAVVGASAFVVAAMTVGLTAQPEFIVRYLTLGVSGALLWVALVAAEYGRRESDGAATETVVLPMVLASAIGITIGFAIVGWWLLSRVT